MAEAGYVWIAMITSARNAAAPGDLPIGDLTAAGLAVASVVRPLKIACIEPTRIVRALGVLGRDAAAEVYASLHGLIGTNRVEPLHPPANPEPAP